MDESSLSMSTFVIWKVEFPTPLAFHLDTKSRAARATRCGTQATETNLTL